jgi:hypothetical protein
VEVEVHSFGTHSDERVADQMLFLRVGATMRASGDVVDLWPLLQGEVTNRFCR